MNKQTLGEERMVAMQLTTDEGAYICNIEESDIAKMAAGKPGTFVILHCAIRLDAMIEGQCELYRAKRIETDSIDHYQCFQKKTVFLVRKGPRR
jgi:hypothetical protein